MIPLKDGSHVIIKHSDRTYIKLNRRDLEGAYFSRMKLGTQLKDFYFRKISSLREIVYLVNKPLFIEDDKVNLGGRSLYKYNECIKYDDQFSEDTKGKVQKMLNYLKEVWAGDNEDVY